MKTKLKLEVNDIFFNEDGKEDVYCICIGLGNNTCFYHEINDPNWFIYSKEISEIYIIYKWVT